ncbi:pitrilysin family protein [Mangrovibacterium marinum]|uniref:Putative Zn-dependent peptidase n=1 Tax=Mangrovibacterium marinum TaxID=1639118 RepID=A0A2T5C3Q4_9BACT|nr:pitrilysin family protein [Mangrovibacterium marinum]PTN09397.1 putative Zn-dependent peptidase [Mangrovibacterium marinum]
MSINRTIAPALHPIGKPDLVRPEKHVLKNGIPVYALKAGKQEVCKIDFVFNAGVWYQPKQLLASLTNAMLQEGTAKYTAAEIAELFDFHGAYLQCTADYHYATISVITLDKHIGKLLPVVEDMLKASVFPEKEFNNLLNRRKQRFMLEMEKVKILCQKKFSQVLFGEGHPYALGLKAEDFENVCLDDFVDFYNTHYHAQNCELHLAGQFTDKVIQQLDHHFGGDDWNGTPVETPQFHAQPQTNKRERVHKEGAIQSAIRLGKLLVDKQHPDYFGLQILVTILGGYFSSRLMLNIREDKGYTYGIGANFINLNREGYLLIATEVDKSYEEATLKEITFEIERLQNEPVPQDELERVRQYLTGEFLRDFDGAFALGQAFRNLHDFGLDYSFYDNYHQAILSITAEQLQQLAKQYLQTDSLYTVVAGQ